MRSSAKEAMLSSEAHPPELSSSSFDIQRSRMFTRLRMWDPVKEKANIMSSLVSDEILKSDRIERDVREIKCCMLYSRVAGLNKLVAKYMNMGTGYIEELSEILNKILGQMVQEMLASGGDILRFGTNSLIAIWKNDDDDMMGNYVHQALDCAVVINKDFNIYINENKYPLIVQLAVTAGDLFISFIGDESHTNMLIFGELLEEMKVVRKKNMVDSIIVSTVALQLVNAHEYIHESLDSGQYFKISGLSPAWRQITRVSCFSDNRTVDFESSSSSSSQRTLNVEDRPNFYLRPITMKFCFDDFAIKKMRRFLTESIARSIEFEEPLQNLTEIRYMIVASACIKIKDSNVWNLLAIAEESVRIFQKNAAKYLGTVYNVEIVNMDIYVSIVFGLRGFKHTLECKSSLLGCLNSKNEIRVRFANLESISVGIVRGKIFCTMVGHSLRRDFVLMGSNLVRVELMATAYENKVTCDEEVFIHSKLKHNSFKLQKDNEKYHKYFQGPIYEFLQDDTNETAVFTSYPNPTLGNNTEIGLFKEHLKKWLQGSDDIVENILLIKGFSKEGKTRLLRDMIRNAEPGVPVNHFKLRLDDQNNPFHVLVNIFGAPLGWTSSMTIIQKKNIIKKFLPKMKALKKLKSLYEVLQLNKPMPKLTPAKYKMMCDCLVELCIKCFKTPWLIAIDDVDFMDNKSWDALQPLIETNLFFLLMTCQRSYQIEKTHTYQQHTAAVFRLHGLAKKFIGSFACQVLNVYGIPADLEFILHKKSDGNPGWIKNFLVSLVETEKLVIRDVPYQSLSSSGLVCPPINSIFRLSKEEEDEIDSLTLGHPIFQGGHKNQIDLWTTISDTWKELEEHDILIKQAIIKVHLKSENCRVCYVSENFSLENVESEETRDVYVAQILDSLSYKEQIFLKCCSILGLTFLRDLLYFVNPASVHFDFSRIVQKMFERNILVCAGGDFTEKSSLMRKKIQDPSNLEVIFCECRNLIIEDKDRYLPKYASCGYLRFKTSAMKDIVYNTLSKNQRIEFHSKAINYLQEQLKKCSSCGGGRFNIGPPNQAALKKKKRRKKITKDRKFEFFPGEYFSDQGSLSFGESSPSIRNSMLFGGSRTLSLGSARSDRSSLFDEFEVSPYDQESSFMFSNVILHYKKREGLTRTFSYTDFTFCECDEILSDYYYQMIIHYRGTEQLEQMLQNMIAYVKMCLLFENISEAKRMSEEAQQTIERIFEQDLVQQWKRPLLEAKIYNLQARILLYTREDDQALELLLLTMKKFNRPLPSTNISRLLKLKWNKWRILISAVFQEASLESEISLEQYSFFCDFSDTLGLLCDIYTAKKQFFLAELTAMWSLTKALKAKANYTKIFLAFERVLHVYEYLPLPKTKILLETMALLQCHKNKETIELEEFRAITKLYSTISRIRFQLAEIASATELSYTTVKMFFTQRFNQPFRSALIILSTYLIWGWSFQESSQVLNELDLYTNGMGDIEGRIWYYCQSLYFHLQVGYTIVSYQQCIQFCEEYSIRQRPLKNTIGIQRLITIMWLWCLRNEMWEEADTYKLDIKKITQQTSTRDPSLLHCALFVTEGYLLYLVHKLDKMNLFEIPEIIVTINRLFELLDKYAEIFIVVEPTVLILKAYYLHIQNKEKDCFKLMDESLKISKKHQNVFHEKFGEYLIKAWKKELSQDVMNFWRNHSDEDNLLYYVILLEEDERIGFFTYPTPKYINIGIFPNARDFNWKKLRKLKKIFLK